MKQILLFCFVLGFTTNSMAQYADTTKHTLATDYLKKSKNQKTAAWIMLIGGTVATTIGIGVALGTGLDCAFGDPNCGSNQTLADVLSITGIAAVLGSIPLFIAAGKNRRKAAASVSFKMGNATNIYQWAVYNRHYLTVAIQVRL